MIAIAALDLSSVFFLKFINEFTVTFGQNGIHPFVRKFSSLDGSQIVGHPLSLRAEPLEQRPGNLLGRHDYSVHITDYDVTRVNDNTAALDGKVDFTGSPVQRANRSYASCEDWKAL